MSTLVVDAIKPLDSELVISTIDLVTKGDLNDPSKGVNVLMTKPAGTQSPLRSVYSKLMDVVSIKDFGTLGVGNDTAVFQAAYDYVAEGGKILIPGPGPYSVGILIGTKKVTWEGQYDLNTNVGLLSLPGTVTGRIGPATTVYRSNGLGTDFANFRSYRSAGYDGGAAGNVCSNIYAKTTVSSNLSKSFEWVSTFILDNSGPGQNVAVYGQANRRATSADTPGGTFAGCFEASDYTQEANPTSGLITCEFDTFANGGDSVGRRVTLDIVVGRRVAGGETCEAHAAIRIGPQANSSANGRYKNGFLMTGDKDYGVRISGTTAENVIELTPSTSKIGVRVGGASSDAGFVHDGIAPYGLRLSGTYSGAAIRIASGAGIAFEGTAAIQQKYVVGSNAIQIINNGVVKTSFSTVDGSISVGDVKVVGLRNTGWAAMTGTSNKGTTYATSTMTHEQLCERVKSIQDALTTHGLLGL